MSSGTPTNTKTINWKVTEMSSMKILSGNHKKEEFLKAYKPIYFALNDLTIHDSPWFDPPIENHSERMTPIL